MNLDVCPLILSTSCAFTPLMTASNGNNPVVIFLFVFGRVVIFFELAFNKLTGSKAVR